MELALRVSRDRLQALLDLPADQALDESAFQQLLASQRVSYGLIPEMVKTVQMKALVDRTLVVAQGQAPVHGQDARIEVLLPEPVAKYGEGTVDLREQHHFREVSKDLPMLRLMPAEAGTPGMNVHGELLAPNSGRSLDLSQCIGPGCERDERNPSVVIAQFDGIYQRFSRGGRPFIQVLSKVEVPGNLDLTVGNIDTRFPVVIHGDVLSTFVLRCGSTLQVDGSIEDAEITVHSDLVVRGGILPGSTRVKCGGEVRARHVQGRRVRCKRAVIEHGMLNADIAATEDIEAKEVVGGSLVAGGHIKVESVGEPGGTISTLEAGVDPFGSVANSYASRRAPEIESELTRAKEQCRLMARRVQAAIVTGEDHSGEDVRLRDLLQSLDRLRRERSGLLEVQRKHTERVALHAKEQITSTITVSRIIWPGVTVRLGEDAAFVVDQPLKRVRFRREGKRVLAEPY